jgi:phosphatidylserine/phosphatidylglycerophosphate/cardiolipin synthase-like enzyme
MLRGKAYILIPLGDIMANDFLENHSVVDEIIKLIESARDELTIITPFLNLDPRMKNALNSAKNSDVSITLYTKWKEKLAAKDEKHIDFFKSIGAEIVFIDRLHSKLYVNEREAVMCSMNMVAGSQSDSQEIGIFTNDERLVRDFNAYAGRMYKRKMSDDFSPKKSAAKDSPSRKKEEANMGYCIRTKSRIPFDKDNPFTPEKMKIVLSYKTKNYPEKYCHFTGEDSNGKTTYARPILSKNWDAAKDKHGL